jgi:hypothetical protein
MAERCIAVALPLPFGTPFTYRLPAGQISTNLLCEEWFDPLFRRLYEAMDTIDKSS